MSELHVPRTAGAELRQSKSQVLIGIPCRQIFESTDMSIACGANVLRMRMLHSQCWCEPACLGLRDKTRLRSPPDDRRPFPVQVRSSCGHWQAPSSLGGGPSRATPMGGAGRGGPGLYIRICWVRQPRRLSASARAPLPTQL
jgi:hypothetical protein